jgi:dihydrodipicolinate synthase/N-acetylneuraminate lyase
MKSLRGSFVAIVTPMQGDGSVDFNALERLINTTAGGWGKRI